MERNNWEKKAKFFLSFSVNSKVNLPSFILIFQYVIRGSLSYTSIGLDRHFRSQLDILVGFSNTKHTR